MIELTRKNVIKIYEDCLFRKEELDLQTITIEGITHTANLSLERLNNHTQDIIDMLTQLPDNFMASKGGGWSFLNACLTNTGEMWTFEHQDMENLFILGMGIKKVKCLLPRELWRCFTGGMPYYEVIDYKS